MYKRSALTYKQAGVFYDTLDSLKRIAQSEGKKTIKNLRNTGFRELNLSRGESAYILESKYEYLVFVEEGLGTKCLVADEMYKITGKSYYDTLAHDTVAMMVNDLITVGAKPVTIMAYWATGSSEWFSNAKKMSDLVDGWRKACDLSGAVWGGGETPTLKGVINETTIDLAGSCFGVIKPKSRLTLGNKLQTGDAIILFESSGIHANGLTLARKIAEGFPQGYKSKISDGRMYGDALLKPTIIYTQLIEELYKNKIDIHYMVNITGHGWRKLMRHPKSFTYRITSLPPVPPVLQFIVEKGPVYLIEAYGNFNMGAGFAIFVPNEEITRVMKISQKHRINAYTAGTVEKGKKQVIIEPKNITFTSDTLNIRT